MLKNHEDILEYVKDMKRWVEASANTEMSWYDPNELPGERVAKAAFFNGQLFTIKTILNMLTSSDDPIPLK